MTPIVKQIKIAEQLQYYVLEHLKNVLQNGCNKTPLKPFTAKNETFIEESSKLIE